MADYEAIITTYLEEDKAEASYVIFDDIPDTYRHLEIHFSCQSNRASYGNDPMIIRLGDDNHSPTDGGSNYSWFMMDTDTSGVACHKTASTNYIYTPRISTKYSGAANFASGSIFICDYSDGDKITTLWMKSGMTSSLDESAANDKRNRFGGAIWNDSNTVNAIHMLPGDGSTWSRGSVFTLYGLKGAANNV